MGFWIFMVCVNLIMPLLMIVFGAVFLHWPPEKEELPASLKAHYDQLSANADACIGCKSCESRCPFGVKIAERMARTKAQWPQ